MELGAESSRVAVTGNIKFDEDSLVPGPSDVNFLISKDEFCWVAGSTHPGEEDIVLDVYRKIIKDNPRWRLVIAPRHINRVPQIMELITRRGMKAVKFSHIPPSLTPPTRGGESNVVVVDTIGQLRFLYSLASLVFVGKSLCVGGGQNIIEPAFYGKAIVIGPKVENFRDIVASFKENKAIAQVQDAHAFEIAVRELCADPSNREVLGNAAREVVTANQGATRRCLERLSEFIQ
jgi:3-deoxy-D-manno-octulosonic-acid transferase